MSGSSFVDADSPKVRTGPSPGPGSAAAHGHPTLHNVVADAALWCAMVILLFLFRGVMLWLFWDQMDTGSGADQIARCFATGIRFDILIATYAVLPSLALTLAGFVRPAGPWHDRVRRWLAFALVAVTMMTFVINVGYFREYHDQFNHWIFGLVFDDRAAIAQTIWKSYPVIWLVILVIALTAALFWLGRRLWRAVSGRIVLPSTLASGWRRFATALMLVGLLILGTRASLGMRPIQMKDAAITRDPFLNKLVMNPYAALRYAIKHHRMLTRSSGLRLILPDGDVRAAARAWFPAGGNVTNLDEAVKRVAQGSPTKPAQHIFLIVLESYDAWGLRPECAALHATDRLAALGRAGISADAFLSAADSTMPSLASIIVGLPDTGIHVNYQPSVNKGVPTDTAPIFERLGYRTRFLYGGYLSWERAGEFCREHGFDEIHGGAEMSAQLTGNEWGVDDEVLYDFTLKTLGDKPTFNLIMSTSYHPPFTVDLKAKGFPMERLAPELAARGFTEEETRVLGHLWYSDLALGNFVAAVEKKFPNSLFAITGDHWSRRAFSSRPILFGQRAVPFVLYGPEALRGAPRPPGIAGGHVDIVPTLVELTAPRGFEYHSFGRNLLDVKLPQIGYGNRAVVTPEVIAEVNAGGPVQDMQGRPAHDKIPVEELRLRYRQLHGLSWWRVMKGKDL